MSEDTQHGAARLGGARDTRPLAPRALVLAGGGARAAYEVGVLAAITERAPDLAFPIVTGVSAGAINATYLAAYQGPWAEAVRALRQRWSQLTTDRVFRLRLWPIAWALVQGLAQAVFGGHRSAAAVRGLVDLDPLREFLGANIDFTGIDANIAAGRLRAAALSATSYASDETVTFVAAPPEVAVWRRALRHAVRCRLTADHVMASAALPILFPAVRIGEAYYGDGSVRQTAPLAPAIHLGARAILVVTQRSEAERTAVPAGRDYPTAAEVIGLLLHAIFLDALEADAERLERVNRLLARLPSGPGSGGTAASEGLRPVSLLLLRPSRNLGSLVAGSGARLPPLMRWVVRAMGGQRESSVDFLSYLLFDPAYSTALIDLGYADAQAQWGVIERFLATTAD